MIEALKLWLQSMTTGRKRQETGCACCGECCAAFGGHLNASGTDLKRWRSQGSTDLLERVNRLGWIWVDPRTKQPEQSCPFIERTGPDTACCSIYETRPDICRDYPTLAHGRRCLRGVFLKIWIAVCCGAVREFETVASALSSL